MTPTPWKAVDVEGPPPPSRYNRWAMVLGPDGAVIVPRMNRVDAHYLVMCVNSIGRFSVEQIDEFLQAGAELLKGDR